MPDGSTPEGQGTYASAEEVQEMLERFAGRLDMDFRFGVEAQGLDVAQNTELVVATPQGPIRTRRLIIATGEYELEETPVLPGLESHVHHHSGSFDISMVRPGERVLVIGSRASAADLVERLLTRGATITVSARGAFRNSSIAPPGSFRSSVFWAASGIPTPLLPPAFRCREAILPVKAFLKQAAEEGTISSVGPTVALTDAGVMVDPEGLLETDHVVFATGYRRDLTWLGPPALSPSGRIQQRGGLSTTVQRLGFLGISCMRNRRSGFLRGLAADAAAVVERLA
jgi:putative flavoprotein involved in K+ transport